MPYTQQVRELDEVASVYLRTIKRKVPLDSVGQEWGLNHRNHIIVNPQHCRYQLFLGSVYWQVGIPPMADQIHFGERSLGVAERVTYHHAKSRTPKTISLNS
jgi:hypothetical protein